MHIPPEVVQQEISLLLRMHQELGLAPQLAPQGVEPPDSWASMDHVNLK